MPIVHFTSRMHRAAPADAPAQKERAASVHGVAAPGLSEADLSHDVQAITRDAARSSRSSDEAVVAALLGLRRLLAARGIAPASKAFRAARQLFLEVYYFRG